MFAGPQRTTSATASLFVHGAVVLALLSAASVPVQQKIVGRVIGTPGPVLLPRDFARPAGGPHDNAGHGSNHQRDAASEGPLPPRSSIQLVRPTLPVTTPVELPAPPTILDREAPAVLRPFTEIGVPGNFSSDSAGNRGGRGIGDRSGNDIGNGGEGPAGEGDSDGPGTRAAAMPACLYCPDPVYSDAAREAKLQGMVTLRVLVTADGRAGSIQMVRGIGLGLDERAIAAVRSWRFKPARSASGKAVSDWILVETVFRLF
jgi:periplasmic protein TonB